MEEVIALIKSYQPDLVMNIALPYQDLTSWMPAWRAASTIWIPAKYEARGHRGTGVEGRL